MGMGEPLLNLDNLRKAIFVFTDPKGLNISRKRITVSTCGITDALLDIANKGPYVRLALSLVTADEHLRRQLMPIAKNNPLEKIKDALILFQRNGGGRITLELPLLGKLNTRETDAKSIYDFSKGLETVINIIPWNPVNGLQFENKPLYTPSKEEISNFIGMLEARKLKVTTRLHKGRSVMGACGQLGTIN
jgi:23S rRNA (adenine2503-C2)-methyltransferase